MRLRTNRFNGTRKFPLVLVNWVDSCSWHEWQSPESAAKAGPTQCRTVGWQITGTKKSISVVQSVNECDDVSETWIIPRSCVRRIRRLR